MSAFTSTDSDLHFPRTPGSIRLPRIAGIPIELHWTCVFGGLALSAAGSHQSKLLLPMIVGYLAVILIHEAGHAVAARSQGLRVHGIRLRGLGGACFIEAPPGARATLIVFSAGLLAQLVLFAATLAAEQLIEQPQGPTLGALIFALTVGNVFAFVYSLIPMKSRAGRPSDGRVLLQLALDRWHGRTVIGGTLPSMNATAQSPVFAPETALLGLPALVPAGFRQGVEILNDTRTPLEFVIGTFQRHLGMDGREAITKAVEIHNRGGVLVPLASLDDARRVAAAVAADAEAAGHAFVCRAVGVEPAAPGA